MHSSLPYGGQLQQCRGSAFLRELALWHRLCTRVFVAVWHIHLLTLCQNGNLINTQSLLHFMDATAHRHINTTSDSEVLLNVFADNLQKTGKFRINEEDIFNAIAALMSQCKGAYACVAMLAGFGIIAFRDPHGIRPLGLASRKSASGDGKDYLFASESVVADASGFTGWEDVKPGEYIYHH